MFSQFVTCIFILLGVFWFSQVWFTLSFLLGIIVSVPGLWAHFPTSRSWRFSLFLFIFFEWKLTNSVLCIGPWFSWEMLSVEYGYTNKDIFWRINAFHYNGWIVQNLYGGPTPWRLRKKLTLQFKSEDICCRIPPCSEWVNLLFNLDLQLIKCNWLTL